MCAMAMTSNVKGKPLRLNNTSASVLAETVPATEDDMPTQALVHYLSTPGRDINSHSKKAPIDITFQSLRAVLEDFEKTVTGWPWSATISLSRGDRLVEIAVLAAGSAVLGSSRNDKQLICLSRMAYQNILQQLRRRLDRGGWGGTPLGPLMNTVEIALAGVEIMESTVQYRLIADGQASEAEYTADGSPKWLSHYRTCLLTFQLAGPAAYQTSVGLHILRAMKPKILFISMFDRKKLFLDDHKWRTVPYQIYSKNVEDELWHLVERVPGLLERADSVMLEYERTADMDCLFNDILALKYTLQDWLSSLQASYPDLLTVALPSSTALLKGSPHLVTVFPRCYIFRDARLGDLMTIYWFYEIRLISILLKLATHLQSYPTHSHFAHDQDQAHQESAAANVALAMTAADLDQPAENICGSMEYMYHLRGSTANDTFHYPATLPLRAAMYHYAKQSLVRPESVSRHDSLQSEYSSSTTNTSPITSTPTSTRSSISSTTSSTSACSVTQSTFPLTSTHTTTTTASELTQTNTSAPLRLAWCKAVLANILQGDDFRVVLSETYIDALYGTVADMEAKLAAKARGRAGSL
jgi:hypothetical protein